MVTFSIAEMLTAAIRLSAKTVDIRTNANIVSEACSLDEKDFFSGALQRPIEPTTAS